MSEESKLSWDEHLSDRRNLILPLRNKKDLEKWARHLAEICKQNNQQTIPLVPDKQILLEIRKKKNHPQNKQKRSNCINSFLFPISKRFLQAEAGYYHQWGRKKRQL